MKERNSNIELLRIISMLTIISGHLLEQSGAIKPSITYIIGAKFVKMMINKY